MDDILNRLFEGELHPEEELTPKTEAYARQRARVKALDAAFRRSVDEETARAYLQVIEANDLLTGIEVENAYIEGMKMGARMTAALLDRREGDASAPGIPGGGDDEDEFEP